MPAPAGTLNEGTVTFQLKTAGGADVGAAATSPLVDGAVRTTYLLPAAQAAGTYTLFATYSGSGNVGASSDNTQTLEVLLVPLLTSVEAANVSVMESAAAQNVTLNATVTGDGDAVEAGTVTFQLTRDGINVGSAVTSGTVANGAAGVSYGLPAGAAPGDYVIETSYSGGTHFLESQGIGTLTVIGQTYTAVQNWRMEHFGTIDNTGDAADDADPDHDGILNIMEFAFGTDPLSGASGPQALAYTGTFAGGGTISVTGQPIMKVEAISNGVDFRVVFGRRKDYMAAGLTYTVQLSADLMAWENSTDIPTVVASDAEMDAVTVPYLLILNTGGNAQFLRVVVNGN